MNEERKLREYRRPILKPALQAIGFAIMAASPMVGQWSFAMIFLGVVVLASAGSFDHPGVHDRP
jgi:hypothetical protein